MRSSSQIVGTTEDYGCRVSEWSEWSECEGCRGFTISTRRILVCVIDVFSSNGKFKEQILIFVTLSQNRDSYSVRDCNKKLTKKRKCHKLPQCSENMRRRSYVDRRAELNEGIHVNFINFYWSFAKTKGFEAKYLAIFYF